VGRYTLSLLTEGDLDDIGMYTRGEWGDAQCAPYLDRLETARELLADDPRRGRPCGDIRPDLHRYETGRHVVFFRRLPDCIRVLRFLHNRMLPDIHDFEDDDEGER
jgi:toxin ParE1/3/4